jgi:probable phosphoglycerate mutase
MTQVLVARHGETDWNREGRWQGHGGPGLNDHGRAQARALAERLRPVAVQALYTSDLDRARQTAEIVAAAIGIDPVLEPGLREVDNGDWRGLTREQVHERNPEGYQRWLEGGSGWAGGETYQDMHARVVATLERLAAAHPGGSILLVAHGGTVRTVVAHAVGLTTHDRRHIDGAANCSLTTVEHTAEAVRLLGFNDVGHLLG